MLYNENNNKRKLESNKQLNDKRLRVEKVPGKAAVGLELNLNNQKIIDETFDTLLIKGKKIREETVNHLKQNGISYKNIEDAIRIQQHNKSKINFDGAILAYERFIMGKDYKDILSFYGGSQSQIYYISNDSNIFFNSKKSNLPFIKKYQEQNKRKTEILEYDSQIIGNSPQQNLEDIVVNIECNIKIQSDTVKDFKTRGITYQDICDVELCIAKSCTGNMRMYTIKGSIVLAYERFIMKKHPKEIMRCYNLSSAAFYKRSGVLRKFNVLQENLKFISIFNKINFDKSQLVKCGTSCKRGSRMTHPSLPQQLPQSNNPFTTLESIQTEEYNVSQVKY